jgi:hypothetical protein
MRGKAISGASAIFIIAFFFLPWFSVSFNGRALVQFSGYQLAIRGSEYAPDGLTGRSILFLIPLAAFVILICLILAHTRPSWQRYFAVAEFAVALFGLLVLIWQWQSGSRNAGLIFSTEPGLWLTVLGFVFVLLGVGVAFREGRDVVSQTADADSAPEPMKEEAVLETAVPISQASDVTVIEKNPPHSTPRVTTKSLYKLGVMADDPSIQAWLIVHEGENIGEKFRIVPPVRIGRDAGNDIIIDDNSISGYHAVVREQGGVYHIQDLNSTNGIYLENMTSHRWQRVPAATLVNNMRIKLGRTVFQFVIRT